VLRYGESSGYPPTEIISDIVSDLSQQGKLDALGKLAPAFLAAVKEHAGEAYVSDVQRPLFLETANATGLVDSLNTIHQKLSAGDTKGALQVLKNVGDYFNQLQGEEADKAKESEIVKRERGQLETQKATQDSAAKTEFNASVAKEARSGDTKSLGAHLGPILKLPFFKGYGRENLQGLGSAIQQAMWQVCKDDKAYQAGIAKLWKAGDRKAILSFHRSFVDSKAKDVVTKTTKQMYPGYTTAKTAAPAAPAANTVTKEQLYNSNFKMPTPVLVAKRPENLVRDFPQAMIYQINGKGAIPNGKGGFNWVAWKR
jgi:hypothetical protein